MVHLAQRYSRTWGAGSAAYHCIDTCSYFMLVQAASSEKWEKIKETWGEGGGGGGGGSMVFKKEKNMQDLEY